MRPYKCSDSSNPYTRGLGIVVMDMQYPFTRNLNIKEFNSQIQAMRKVFQFGMRNDIPLIVVEFEGYGPTISDISWSLKHFPNKRKTSKRNPDMFTVPELRSLLYEVDISELCMTGIYAGRCVLESAISATNLGLNVMTASDLISGQPGQIKRKVAALEWFSSNGKLFQNTDNLLESVEYSPLYTVA